MSWLGRYLRLVQAGILGINRRNAEYILDHNPRGLYPRVDSKLKMAQLCRSIGVPMPAIYAALPTHSSLRRLPALLDQHPDCVIKPDRGSGGRGILVLTGKDENGGLGGQLHP